MSVTGLSSAAATDTSINLMAFSSPARDENAIKLIEVSVAAADDRPVTDIARYAKRGPRVGYWYRALRYRGETTPDPQRFAVCAFPDSMSAGREMYLVTEMCLTSEFGSNIVYRKKIADRVETPEFCPDVPEKDGWEQIKK